MSGLETTASWEACSWASVVDSRSCISHSCLHSSSPSRRDTSRASLLAAEASFALAACKGMQLHASEQTR